MFLTALFVAGVLGAPASVGPTLTLKDAVGLALQHAFSSRIAGFREVSAQAKVGVAATGFVPQLYATGSDTAFQYGVNKKYYLEAGFPSSAIPPNFYGKDDALSINAQYLLIDTTRRLDLKAAQLARDSSEKGAEVAKRQVIRDTARAYLQVVQADALVHLAQEDVGRRIRHKDEAVAMAESGKRADYEVIRADSDLASAQATLVTSQLSANTARYTLAQTVGTEIPLDFVAENPVPPKDPRLERKAAAQRELINDSLSKRPDVLAAELDAAGAVVNVDRNTRHYLPQLSLFATYTKYPLDSSIDTYDNTFVYGAQLTVTFSDMLTNYWRDRDARAQSHVQEIVADQTRVNVSLDVERAMADVDGAISTVASAGKAVDAARRNYETAAERYRLGVGSQTEQVDAAQSLVEAEVNSAKADVTLRTALWNLRYEMGESLDVQ